MHVQQAKANQEIKRFRDPLTGVKVNSDVVYKEGTRAFDALVEAGFFTGRPGEIGESVEYELSRTHFVATSTTTFTNENGERLNATDREIISGKFKVNKRGALSGIAESYTTGSFYDVDVPDIPWKENEFAAGLFLEASSNRFGGSARPFIDVLTDERNAPNDSNVVTWYKRNNNAQAIEQEMEAGFYSNYDPDKSGLSQLGTASFLKDNWWQNPFASDLI